MTRRWEDDEKNRRRFMALWNAAVPVRRMAPELGISLSTLWVVRTRLGLMRATNQSEAAAWKRHA